MPTLAEMMAAKKSQANPEPSAPRGEESPKVEAKAPAPTPTPAPVGGLRLNSLRLTTPGKPSQPPAGKSSDASPMPAKAQAEQAPATPAPTPPSGPLSLVDLAGMGDSLPDIDPEEEDSIPLDHIPASAPDRKLPEELDKQQAQFVKSLDSIYSLHNDPDMFVDMVRKIMSDMQDNPALVELLADEDSHAMITGLRQQAGMAQVKKQESKAKRGSSGGRSSAKTQSAADSVAASLAAFAGMSLE